MGVIAAAVIASTISEGGGTKENPNYQKDNTPPPSNDYSDASLLMSNNSKTVEEAQIMEQSFGLQQASLDRELQNAANLEQGLATFDTKLETSKLDYFQAMKAESDHHAEKLAALQVQSEAGDLPPPEVA